MISKMDVKELDDPKRVALLELIDKFRHLGLNEDISLPQVLIREKYPCALC